MTSPEQLLLDHLPFVEETIARTARRNHLSREDAEDFASVVKLKLLADDHAVIRKFQGRCSLRTYLVTVVHHLLLDYRNHLWGKWRPSAEARRQGPEAVQLEILLQRDGYGTTEACRLLRERHGSELTQEALENLACRLPSRHKPREAGDEVIEFLPDRSPLPDERLLEAERELARARLYRHLRAAIDKLPPVDRLIVKLRLEDGFTVADAARALRLAAKPLYRRYEAILVTLRRHLEAAGVSRDELAAAFNSDSNAKARTWPDDSSGRPSTLFEEVQ
jgi:RNA polymerase sigma factor (sigma-70 family)